LIIESGDNSVTAFLAMRLILRCPTPKLPSGNACMSFAGVTREHANSFPLGPMAKLQGVGSASRLEASHRSGQSWSEEPRIAFWSTANTIESEF